MAGFGRVGRRSARASAGEKRRLRKALRASRGTAPAGRGDDAPTRTSALWGGKELAVVFQIIWRKRKGRASSKRPLRGPFGEQAENAPKISPALRRVEPRRPPADEPPPFCPNQSKWWTAKKRCPPYLAAGRKNTCGRERNDPWAMEKGGHHANARPSILATR